jgi:hypothetical protein
MKSPASSRAFAFCALQAADAAPVDLENVMIRGLVHHVSDLENRLETLCDMVDDISTDDLADLRESAREAVAIGCVFRKAADGRLQAAAENKRVDRVAIL